MNNKLKEYIDTLFAGAAKTAAMEELKEEMLQNLTDKYNDLIAEGKTEQEAYDAAVTSIGDISGLIDMEPHASLPTTPAPEKAAQPVRRRNGLVTAIAVALYVLCCVPQLVFRNGQLGITMLFCCVALATGLLIWNNPKKEYVHAGLIASGIMLYILCPVAAIIFHGAIGPAMLLLMVAAGTGIIIYANTNAKNARDSGGDASDARTPFYIVGGAVIALMLVFCVTSIVQQAHRRVETDLYVTYGEDFDDIKDEFDDFGDHDDWDDFDDDHDWDGNRKGTQNDTASAPGKPDKDDKQQGGHANQAAQNAAEADTSALLAGGASVPMADIREIEIDWVAGSVRIEAGEGTDIVFAETSNNALDDAQTLRSNVRGNELSISFLESTWNVKDFFSFVDQLGMPKKDLVVKIPAAMMTSGQLTKLEVNGVSADIVLEDAFGTETELKTVSGAISSYKAGGSELSAETSAGVITLSDFNVRKLDIETVSGKTSALGAAQKVDVQTVSGDVDLTLAEVPAEVESEAVSGAISIRLPAGEGNFTAMCEAVSGDFVCEFPTIQNGSRYVAGNGVARFEFESISGDVRIVPAA